MKPKIWNDITNILAKLAGSADYDPRVKYDTSLEYYGNQIPVLPKPIAENNGKYLGVKNGAYEFSTPQMIEVDLTDAEVVLQPADNTQYNCGTLTSLTISNPPETGKYVIIFFSGAIATTTVGIENFVAEANKRYKITVEDNYATYDSWAYTPT